MFRCTAAAVARAAGVAALAVAAAIPPAVRAGAAPPPEDGLFEVERLATERRGGWTASVERRTDAFMSVEPTHDVLVRGRPGAGGAASRLDLLRTPCDSPPAFRLHERGWLVAADAKGVHVFAPRDDAGAQRSDLHVTSASRFLTSGFLSVGVVDAPPAGKALRIAWAPLGRTALEPAVEIARLAVGASADEALAEAHVRAVERDGGVDVTWIVPGAATSHRGGARWDASTLEVTPLAAPERVRVAAVQCPSDLGETVRNLDRIEGLVADAARAGAKFVVLPEAAVTGYLSQDLKTVWHIPGWPQADAFPHGRDPETAAAPVPGPSTQRRGAIARRWGVYGAAPLVEVAEQTTGTPPETDRVYFNTVALLGPDGTMRAHYRKLRPWPHPEQSWATEGDLGLATAETPYGRVGLAICFDVHEVWAMYAESDRRPWTLLYPIAWVSHGADAEWFGEELPRRARAAGFHVVGANWSTDAPQPWHGAGFSSILSRDGEVLAQARTRTGTEIVVADLLPGR